MTWLEPIGARIVPANFGPMRACTTHARNERLPFWQEQGIPSLVPNLMDEPLDVKTSYN